MDPTFIEHLVIFKTFFGLTAHTGDTIKNDSVFFFYYMYEFIPVRAILFGPAVELSNDSGIGINCGDVGNLTSKLLMLRANTTIGVNHKYVLTFSIKSNCSLF